MSDVSPLEAEVAPLIVRTLTLQVDPAQIRPEEPLFGGGLGTGLDRCPRIPPFALSVDQKPSHKVAACGSRTPCSDLAEQLPVPTGQT